MKSVFRVSVILLVVCARAVAAPPNEAQSTPKDSESDRLQGTWQLQSLTRDGKAQTTDDIAGVQLIFDENQYTYRDKTGDHDHGTFTVKKSANAAQPHEMITLRVDAKGQSKAMTRIYSWVDNDTVRFCSPGTSETRPAKFDAPSGSGRELSVWKRQKS